MAKLQLKQIVGKVVEVTAFEDFGAGPGYTFNATEFPGGLVLVPNETTADEFYPSIEAVEAHGNAVVTGYNTLEIEQAWYPEEILEAIAKSTVEFGPEQFQGDWSCFARLGLSDEDAQTLGEIIISSSNARKYLAL